MDRKFGCRIRNCCTSFYKGNRKIRHNCYLSNRTCPIKKTKRCRVIKRGRCHRNVCCHSKRKNGRLLKKKCYNASKLMCHMRKFVRRCRLIKKRRVVCCTRGYKKGIKVYHKCKLFMHRRFKTHRRRHRRYSRK